MDSNTNKSRKFNKYIYFKIETLAFALYIYVLYIQLIIKNHLVKKKV